MCAAAKMRTDTQARMCAANLATIHSKGGFFMGIIKRFKEQVVASDPVLTTQTYAGLPYLVQAKLETLFTAGLLRRTELDAKCYMELRSLPEVVALEVLDKFCETNLTEIRNKTAFFLGIVKRFRNERGLKAAGGPGMGMGAGLAQPNPYAGQPFITYPGGATVPIGGYPGLVGAGASLYGDPYQQQAMLLQQQQQQAAQLSAAGYG